MNIGIVTLYDNMNIGAALQAYALSQIIREMGHQCTDIRYVRVSNGMRDSAVNRKKRIKMLSKKNGWKTIVMKAAGRVLLFPQMRIRRERHAAFIRERIQLTEQRYVGLEQIKDTVGKFDCFICGSDNIWNRLRSDPTFFLSFVPDDVRKFSYAAGMSATSLTEEEQKWMIPLIERLDEISVRDSVGRELLSGLTKRVIREDLDPTMLYAGEEWRRLARRAEGIPDRFIFCYLLGDNVLARDAARAAVMKYRLPIVTLPHANAIHSSDFGFGDRRLYNVGPYEFLDLMDRAEYVITDSFHGMVFALLFHKQFVVFRRFLEGDARELNLRLDCLLKKCGIDNRIAEGVEKALDILEAPVEYDAVEQRIDKCRNDSLQYLRRMTSGTME